MRLPCPGAQRRHGLPLARLPSGQGFVDHPARQEDRGVGRKPLGPDVDPRDRLLEAIVEPVLEGHGVEKAARKVPPVRGEQQDLRGLQGVPDVRALGALHPHAGDFPSWNESFQVAAVRVQHEGGPRQAKRPPAQGGQPEANRVFVEGSDPRHGPRAVPGRVGSDHFDVSVEGGGTPRGGEDAKGERDGREDERR